MTNAETVIRHILDREAMPVPADVGDGQGVTGAGGQTADWCRTWGVPFPQTEAVAAANLMVWLAKTNLAAVVNADVALGDATADYAYNVGLRSAIKALQTALDVPVDGIVGSVTLAALSRADLSALVRDVAISRIKAIGQGLTAGVTAPRFAAGLLGRAVAFL